MKINYYKFKRRCFSIGCLMMALMLLLNGCSLRENRRSISFVIPQGYVGWIRVKYNVASAPALPIQNNNYVALIPANGLLKTSTNEGEGWGYDKFYYIDKTNKKTRLVDGSNKTNNVVWGDSGRTDERVIFIGTQKQWSDAQRLIGGKEPGALKLPITADSESKN